MSIRPRQNLASNGRDVRELPRKELENLILELEDELTARTKKVHELKSKIIEGTAKTKKSESMVKDLVLDYVVPPSSLRPGYAKNYAGKDALEYMAKKEKTPRKESQLTGAYNPYNAGNKRIVTLRQKAGELQQKIADTVNETELLIKERQRLKAILEREEPHTGNKFRHNKPIPKTKGKKVQVTFKKCLQLLEQMIEQEKDQFRKDCYKCCYLLLSGDDRGALEMFSILYDPNLNQESLRELQDILNDRNAQVSILKEQYNHLDSRQEALRNAFISLKEKMVDHVIDNDDDVQILKDRIAELEKMIEQIPLTEEKIKLLKEERDKLLDEKDNIFRNGSEEAGKIEAEMISRKAQISSDRAGYDQEKRQLEEVDARLRTQYETIAEEVNRLKSSRQKLAEELHRTTTEKQKMHDKLAQLSNVGITEPQHVREVYIASLTSLPEELEKKRQVCSIEFKDKRELYLELKRTCIKLQKVQEDKQLQAKSYRDRLANANQPQDDDSF